jgi:hypothetical protein
MAHILYYIPEQQNPSRKGRLYLGRFCLNPGRNKVGKDVLDTLKDHPLYDLLIKQGALKVSESDTVKEEVEGIDLRDLSTKDAEVLIMTEHSLRQIEDWRDKETRKGVLNMLARQKQAIENGVL